MKQLSWFLSACSVLIGVSASAQDAQGDRPGARERQFELTYSLEISGLAPGARTQVWLPVPPSNEDQSVTPLAARFPAPVQTNTDRVNGNTIIYWEAPAPSTGECQAQTAYRVTRREVRGLPGERSAAPATLSKAERQQYLAPNRKIPLTGRPLELLAGTTLPQNPLQLSRLFYDRVDDHVKYDKSRPGYGQGDVNWVCDSGFGNCTDFHSLFISWARAHGLPARFEIGFPLPEEKGAGAIAGYHCWAFVYIEGHGWIPVDISEADKNPALKEYYFGHLTENRVSFTSGRDLNLVPRQAGEPLNFFVYPYVEVEGRVWPQEQIKLTVRYQDIRP
jgi:transglutaminase-like putative cysteine protease